jgi:hypothetical protein
MCLEFGVVVEKSSIESCTHTPPCQVSHKANTVNVQILAKLILANQIFTAVLFCLISDYPFSVIPKNKFFLQFYFGEFAH